MISPSRRPRRLVIVADDLTGACDAAVPFAAAGAAAYIGLRWDDPPPLGWQVFGINTDTRCSPSAEAAERAKQAFVRAQQLQPERIVKKIDSLLRGNVAEEIAAARTALERRLTLLAPAFPALGRRVRGGKVWVDGLTEPIDIESRLQGMRCAAIPNAALEEFAAFCSRAIGEGAEVLIPDSEDEDQMRRLARAAAAVDGLLWVGSGGLTKAIAEDWEFVPPGRRAEEASMQGAESLRRMDKPLLFCAGSDHPITQAQLNSLRQRADVVFAHAGADGCAAANAALRDDRNAVLIFARADLNPGAMREMAERIRLELCGGLLLTGGDTAIHVLNALDVKSIRLTAEVLPGIPQGLIVGGGAGGLAVMTKSGAFGAPDALSRCVEILRAPQTAAAQRLSEEAVR